MILNPDDSKPIIQKQVVRLMTYAWNTNTRSYAEWATYLQALAQPVIDRYMSDHIGNADSHASDFARTGAAKKPRELLYPLIAHGLGASFELPDIPLSHMSGVEDVMLWWALYDSSIDIRTFVDLTGDGPLYDSDIGQTYATIEVWTETELAGLHALSHYARVQQDATNRQFLFDRISKVITWHIEHTQPDNATCHPWAVHVFLQHKTPESQHYAETLLSNCLVANAKPDPMSAWILLDASHVLEHLV